MHLKQSLQLNVNNFHYDCDIPEKSELLKIRKYRTDFKFSMMFRNVEIYYLKSRIIPEFTL